jgi:hypothetical protein
MTPASAELVAEINRNLDHLAEAADIIVASIANMRDYINGTNQPTFADTFNRQVARMQQPFSAGGTV